MDHYYKQNNLGQITFKYKMILNILKVIGVTILTVCIAPVLVMSYFIKCGWDTIVHPRPPSK